MSTAIVPPAERFAGVIFEAHDLASVPYETVRGTVAEHGLACVRGLFDVERLRTIYDGIVGRFDPRDDRRHDPRDSEAVRRNFQKLQVGANSGVGSKRTLGRFMRVLYNPIFAEDIYGMRAVFVTLARFRNLLYGLSEDHAVTGTDRGYWTCSRLLQYPKGGGFIVPHRDLYAQVATIEAGLGYFQPLLLVTEKNRDFHEGGGYVDVGEERFFYEPFTRVGDVVVYDGRSVHGVADIDPLEPLELTRFGGRVVALASLFRRLEPGGDEYARMAKRAGELLGTGREP